MEFDLVGFAAGLVGAPVFDLDDAAAEREVGKLVVNWYSGVLISIEWLRSCGLRCTFANSSMPFFADY